jgi:nucleotide-binding universal stress UspA family protein
MSEAQLQLACCSANDIGGVVRVLHVVERSRLLPLDAPLSPEEHQQVDALLAHAEQVATCYGVRHEMSVVCARSVGVAIIADAEEHGAQMNFVGLRDRHRRGTHLLLSATLRHVLHNAPCPVQIGYLPAGLSEYPAREDVAELM